MYIRYLIIRGTNETREILCNNKEVFLFEIIL